MTDSKRPDPLKYCFVRLFQNRCKLNDEIVPVLGRIPHKVTLPSVVIIRESAPGETDSQFGGVMGLLPEDDPHYDPNKQYVVQQKILTSHKGCIGIYLSATTDEDRTELHLQIEEILKLSRMFHYSCCKNYDPLTQNCSTTLNKCDALTVLNRYSRSLRCPYCTIQDKTDPNYRGTVTWYYDTGIDIGTLAVTDPEFVEETTIIPEIYGAIIKISFDYYTSTVYPAHPGFNINTENEVK